MREGTSLVVQWLRLLAPNPWSVNYIIYAATKTLCSQINIKKRKKDESARFLKKAEIDKKGTNRRRVLKQEPSILPLLESNRKHVRGEKAQ